MNAPENVPDPLANASSDQVTSALFASLVMQQTSTALMLMGQAPHPESGKTVKPDMEAAQYFIDQLDMLQKKTKGNLNKDEEHLLNQSLMSVRMAFVEAVNSAGDKPEEPRAGKPVAAEKPPAEAASGKDEPDESRKKFSKKY